jgi:glycosyltransferase involved in cell wall biosynthesis
MGANILRRTGLNGNSLGYGTIPAGQASKRRGSSLREKGHGDVCESYRIAMVSVVIAAHDEAAVIGRCLDSLLADAKPGEFDVTVVANGCTDGTAAVAAARSDVRVVELPEPSKSKALNAGDRVATGFPRIYLDADIVVTAHIARIVTGSLNSQDDASDPAGNCRSLVAVPRRDLELSGRPLLVRGYFAIHRRLPVFREGLFGRGMIALSAEGRARFDQFPEMVADDLFLDAQFSKAEKRHVIEVATVVATPWTTRDLVRRLTRVRRGNAALRDASQRGQVAVAVAVRKADRVSWFRDVVAPNPRLGPAAIAYVMITAWSAVLARRDPGPGDAWGRDSSTRDDTALGLSRAT